MLIEIVTLDGTWLDNIDDSDSHCDMMLSLDLISLLTVDVTVIGLTWLDNYVDLIENYSDFHVNILGTWYCSCITVVYATIVLYICLN